MTIVKLICLKRIQWLKALFRCDAKFMNKSKYLRLDDLLVSKGVYSTLEEATAHILKGDVYDAVSGRVLDKVGEKYSIDIGLRIAEPSRFVSRAGDKLYAFLHQAKIKVEGISALDVGASTGGFTDCLLQLGASQVFAVDVGSHQLHEKLRVDSRVKSYEQIDIRKFDFSSLKTQIDLITVDVSFISLKQILPVLYKNFPAAKYILLFKPQFEVPKGTPLKRGVAPAAAAEKSLLEMLLFLKELGLNPLMHLGSAVKGTKGNQEVFIMAEVSSQIPRHIFRTYDIRGLADRDLSNATVERIGRAFGKRLLKKFGPQACIGIGHDDRVSSPRVLKYLTYGLQSVGVGVVDLGSIPTPMAYFAHYNFEIDALLQVTASHNPKDDNGLKMMMGRDTLFGPEITSLADEAESESFTTDEFDSPRLKNIYPELRKKYLDYLHTQFRFDRKFKIVLDCGNGMTGSIARDVFAPYASGNLEILFEDVDCTFPNHEADPTIPENLVDLQKAVVASKADVGFAFDGDGDRLGVVSRSGRILWGDEILMLLSELVLRRQPGSTIIGEVKCSEKLFRMIEERGGVPLMYKTGHSLIKKKMKELKAPIAGEMSGHLFFGDRYFGFDDAAYGALRVLEVMAELKIDLDEWVKAHPSSFVTPEIRVDCPESEKAVMVEKVKSYFSQMTDVKLNLIDGVRVGFEDSSWALVRASNTQAVLVVRIEATTQKKLLEIRDHLSKALGKPVRAEVHV